MSNLPSTEFTATVHCAPPVLTVRLTGDLDYDTSDELLDAVTTQLTHDLALRDVHLDFGELTAIDSSGLSALLMIHRRTSTTGATLHLDCRPGFLDRMLHITNVLDHLTTPAANPPTQHSRNDGDYTEIGVP
ncbi:anti-anti-sigma factor [Streptomyces sp. 1222.5]|uniref:STAS domain-containing protein n=1 Tax=unclassified Streptomyces TaxID=2593676 RepID=UPI00089CFC04|nr:MULTISPECIES: STAS domain-containing protein [unclassified Streptomyces]PKW05161.1 anti-anti-sigma factor [Streptomyces sp. 5112.2]SED48739.1 anti-anti-sigma factor [Streptomyces sp. 1222.5]